MRREPDGSYTLLIGKPIDCPEGGTRQERMASMAQAFAVALEERLREDPTQWAAFYPVWKCERNAAAVVRPEQCSCSQPAEVHP